VPRNAAELWQGLALGRWKIEAHQARETHCELSLRSVPTEHAEPLAAEDFSIFERVLVGDYQKVIAIEREVSYSTVSTTLAKCSQGLGLKCKMRGVPLLLVLAAQARRQPKLNLAFGHLESSRLFLALRPDATLKDRLTPIEYEIARLVIEGKSHAEISQARRTTPRTIANQIGSLFGKLRVKGRFELIAAALANWSSAAPHYLDVSKEIEGRPEVWGDAHASLNAPT
jgi:DNA-binding CsgD family transcriptional regulator